MWTSLADPEFILEGSSLAAVGLREQVSRAGPHFRTALLTGETGSLKEQVARALHRRSPLCGFQFRAVEAGALLESTFAATHPETIYLESLEELATDRQLALLGHIRRAFRSATPQFRLICSSSLSPRGLVAAGRLHPELYKCLSALEIRIAPLRERIADLQALLGRLEMDREVTDALCRHHWPGNFDELQEVLAACTQRAGRNAIRLEHLPALPGLPTRPDEELRLDTVLRKHVHSVLEGCAGNKLRAAEMLGISRSTLYRMLDAGQGSAS